MVGLIVYSIIFTTLLRYNHSYAIDGGWIPLTNDEVLRKFSQGFTRRSTIDAHSYLPIYSDGWNENYEIVGHEAIKEVTPIKKLQIGPENVGFIKPELAIKTEVGVKEYNKPDCSINEKVIRNQITNNSITNIPKRQPKVISEFVYKNGNIDDSKLEINIIKRNTDEPEQKNDEYIEHKESQNIYKVTEDVMDTLDPEYSTKERTGYFYKPPPLNPNNPIKHNITDTFIDILSKYNIKADDELPNYALSRQTKVQNPRNYMLPPIPLRNQPRFNNLNHLTVDPLVAVFLSNYGYYLPGLFGIQSKYRNRYGYLASNNIHNNKPFGSYKIFSDTDSSN